MTATVHAPRVLYGQRRQPRLTVPLTLAVDPGAWTGVVLREGLDVIVSTTLCRYLAPGYDPAKDKDPAGSQPSTRPPLDDAHITYTLTGLAYVLDKYCDEQPVVAVETTVAPRPFVRQRRADGSWAQKSFGARTAESVRQATIIAGAVIGWARAHRLHAIAVPPGLHKGEWHKTLHGGTGSLSRHYPAALLSRQVNGMPSDIPRARALAEAGRLGIKPSSVPSLHDHPREAYDAADIAHKEG